VVTEQHQPDARRAGIAVVGFFHWATEAHLPTLATDPQVDAVGLCDPDPRNRASI
jgi:predicted dehydrogenase